MTKRKYISLIVLAFVFCSFSIQAQESKNKQLQVELNNAQPNASACRLSFVFTNLMGQKIEELSLETVLFDPKGSVIRFLVLKSRPLISGKVRVQQYEIKDIRCDQLGKVLLNDMKVCKGAGLSPALCLENAKISSRTSIPFFSTISGN